MNAKAKKSTSSKPKKKISVTQVSERPSASIRPSAKEVIAKIKAQGTHARLTSNEKSLLKELLDKLYRAKYQNRYKSGQIKALSGEDWLANIEQKLRERAQAYNKENPWMTPEQARAHIDADLDEYIKSHLPKGELADLDARLRNNARALIDQYPGMTWLEARRRADEDWNNFVGR